MKILAPKDIRQLEQETVLQQNIQPLVLMERAARAVFLEIERTWGRSRRSFIVFCGFGNNGGDGLAIARMLHEADHDVRVYLLKSTHYSEQNLVEQQRLQALNVAINLLEEDNLPEWSPENIVIDALFGYGLSRPIDKHWEALVHKINLSSSFIIAIDIPSGLFADRTTPNDAPAIKATLTYTFDSPKLSLLLPEGGKYAGTFQILDIGLDRDIRENISSNFYYTRKEDVVKLAVPLKKFSHKGTFGHAWIAGGQYGSIGAIILASKAALKTGCGLVTSYVPSCGYQILQTAFPEALVKTDTESNTLHQFPRELFSHNALGLGMGMGTAKETQEGLFYLLNEFKQTNTKPALLLDADAINILAEHPEWHELIPVNSVLTPHPKELERLLGPWENDFVKLEKATAWSKQFQQVIVIKGANTAVVLPNGDLHFNSTGNPGMATGGSGDVLSGVITSLLAQGYPPETAAIIGVYLHGSAGDYATHKVHEKSLIASDIIRHLSDAWCDLLPETEK